MVEIKAICTSFSRAPNLKTNKTNNYITTNQNINLQKKNPGYKSLLYL